MLACSHLVLFAEGEIQHCTHSMPWIVKTGACTVLYFILYINGEEPVLNRNLSEMDKYSDPSGFHYNQVLLYFKIYFKDININVCR
jgi:hypothetical protein